MSSGAKAFGYGYSKTIPERCFRRRVVLRSPVAGARLGGRTPTKPRSLRGEVFNGVRWVVRTGSPWRYMPHDLPPWEAVYQQTQRWLKAVVFEQMVHDLRVLLRLSEGRASEPSATILALAPCAPPRRAVLGEATKEPSARTAPRYMRRWTLY